MKEENKILTFFSTHKKKIELIVLLILIVLLAGVIADLARDKNEEYRLTICFQCKNKEIRKINQEKIYSYKCSKCGSQIGIAWKCIDCHYEFPLIEKKPPPGTPKDDYALFYLNQSKCPNCRSENTYQMLIKGQPKPKPMIFLPPPESGEKK